MKSYHVTLALFLGPTFAVLGREISLKQTLLRELLSNYSYITSPGNGTEALKVGVVFSPIAVLGLDERAQEFTFSGSLMLTWIDEALAWNPKYFSGISEIDLHPSAIWTPQIIVPSGSYRLSDIPMTISVNVQPSGLVTGMITDVFKTNCYIDVTDFPLDTQTCTLGFTMRHATLALYSEVIDNSFKDYYSTNSEWSVDNINLTLQSVPTKTGSLQFIDVSVVLTRYCTFYVVTIIFPMALLSYMNSLVFLLPPESGEKISYLLSIFVSESVFLSVASDTLARTNNLSKMSLYIVFMLSESCLALVATLVVLNKHHGTKAFRISCRGKNSVSDVKDSEREAGPQGINRLDVSLFLVFVLLSSLSLAVFL